MTNMEPGKVFYRPENVQTGRSYFKLTIQGEGGHGSSPHTANDAIVAGANFVTTAQTIVSRRLNPFETGVVTIGSFDGKGQFNVIKDKIELEGDVRALTDATRDKIADELQQIVKGLKQHLVLNVTLSLVKTIQHYIMTLILQIMLQKL